MRKDKLLEQIGKGAGIVFLTSVLIYLFRFFYRIIISRYLGPSDYGLIAIGEMILQISMVLCLVGLSSGITRFVSQYIAEGRMDKVKGVIYGAFKIVVPISLVASFILITFSDKISVGFFHDVSLVYVLIIFSLTLPLSTIITLFGGSFYGFKKPQYLLFTTALGRELSVLLLTLIIIFLGGSIFQISLIYLISFIIATLISFLIYKKNILPILGKKTVALYNYNELLYFSLPLFFSGIFVQIMGWADTLILGNLKSTFDVGIYNAAMPLATSLAMFLAAFTNIFFPIMNELKAKNKIKEVGITYSIVQRWLFMICLPIILFVILFSKNILIISFGNDYVSGNLVLVILIVASFVNVITGPCHQILMTFNKTKIIFFVNSIMAISNLILNIILIPKYGINGAAIATGITLALRELIIFSVARKYVRINIKLSIYYRFLMSGIIPLIITFIIFNVMIPYISEILLTIILSPVYFVMYVLMLIWLKSFNDNDLVILTMLESKFGFNLKSVRKIINFSSKK